MLRLKNVAFKNNALFRSWIENAGDLDIVMSSYNLLEYSQNYSMTTWRLWSYYRDKIDDINDNVSDCK